MSQILNLTPGLASLQWIHEAVIGETESTYTLATKRYNYGNSRLRAVCTTPLMTNADGLKWQGFFASNRQSGDPILFGQGALQSVQFPRMRQAPGNPVLQRGHEAGATELYCRGMLSQSDVNYEVQNLQAGWFFSLSQGDNTDLYLIREAVANRDDGTATIKIFPALRHSFGVGIWLHFVNPRGQFWVSSYPTFTFDADRHLLPITFELTQV